MRGRSKALNFLKRRKMISSVELSEAENRISDEKTPEDAFLDSEKKRSVFEALKSLSEEMRTAVYLVYIDGMSYGETAKIMKKNTKQIDNLLYRAKAELRSALGKEGKDLK